MTDVRIWITAALLLLASLLPAAAQQPADTTYTFRFVGGKDMFYVPWKDNAPELARLLACVDGHKSDILAGRLPLYVDGYCRSMPDVRACLHTARIRANRVKTELILRAGLTEDCFVTHNHASGGEYVTVRITLPATHAETAPEPETRPDETVPDEAANTGAVPAEPAEAPAQADETAQATPAESHDARQSAPADRPQEAVLGAESHLALRTNLLHWATLTPDLGLEWRIHPSWGILVNGAWTSWSWKGKDRRYALWEVAPEVRHYISKEKRGYLGAMFKAGEFNYKLSATGKQGDLVGGGITGGYQLRLSKALALDFSLALGYLKADYEKYEVVDGVRVRRSNETKNWWGPVNAGVTLVWTIK